MKFDKNRVFTSLNADELSPGDKVILANTMANLRDDVERGVNIQTLREVHGEDCLSRFIGKDGWYPLAYLYEKSENCTNCGNRRTCALQVREHPELEKCNQYISESIIKELRARVEQSEHYRPFNDVYELIAKWWELDGWSKKEAEHKKDKLRMPLIWLKHKYNLCHVSSLITGFFGDKIIVSGETIESMKDLYKDWVFPDGSPCGVKE